MNKLKLLDRRIIKEGDTILLKPFDKILRQYGKGNVVRTEPRNCIDAICRDYYIEVPQQHFNIKYKDICGKEYIVREITDDDRIVIDISETDIYVATIYMVEKKL